MIINLPDCTVREVVDRISVLRSEGGVVALGRVLTLVVVASPEQVEGAIRDANAVSKEHPMRIIVFSENTDLGPHESVIDAQIRVGSDAGASEVIHLVGRGMATENLRTLITGLLLPDTPVVVWWAGLLPDVPAKTDLGQIAQLRIISVHDRLKNNPTISPQRLAERLARGYTPGDTDLAWTRLSTWRSRLASILDYRPELQVLSTHVRARGDSLSALFLANWLRMSLDTSVTSESIDLPEDFGEINSVTFTRQDGDTTLRRISPDEAILSKPGYPDSEVPLPITSQQFALAEELRMLEPDEVYGDLLKYCVM